MTIIKREFKGSLLFLIFITVLLVLAGCGESKKETTSDEVDGEVEESTVDEVVIAQGKDVDTLDPQKQSDTATGNVLVGIFDTLLKRNSDMEIVESLAVDYESLSDTQWKVKLREGVKFHNGENFDAEAVKFTFDRLMDPETKALAKPYFDTFVEVEVVDSHTVHFTTDGYDPLFLAKLTNFYVIPPKYIQDEGDDNF